MPLLTLVMIIFVVAVFIPEAEHPEQILPLPHINGPSILDLVHVPDVQKEECQHLVEGQLVFEPSATMRQGQSYVVFARLSRGTDAKISVGVSGTVVIQTTKVSCLVSITLDSAEPNAFKIDNIPAGRRSDQILPLDQFAQWDFRVAPLKSGVLHLLLYVTPMIYVEGVGQGLKQFPQPPRVITVSPDYVYAFWSLVSDNWSIVGVLLTAIILPFVLWLIRKLIERRTATRGPAGFHN